MALSFYMNGAVCNPPSDWASLSIELSFENNSPAATLKQTSFDFTGAEAVFINNWFLNGMFSGNGVTAGIPFQIKACNNITIIDGVLNLCDATNYFDCDRCTIAIEQTNTVDFISDKADSVPYNWLASDQVIGVSHISLTDYVAIPYVVSSIPNYTQAALLTFTELMTEQQIIYTTLELIDICNKLTASLLAATTTAGLTAEQMLAYVAEFILLLSYITSLIIYWVFNLIQIIDNLIQDLKYKYGMLVRVLFEKACSNLGLTFNSSILQTSIFKDLVIVPQKYTIQNPDIFTLSHRDSPDDSLNSESYGYFDGTFGDLIRAMNDVFNAKVVIKGTTLYFEVFDGFNNITSYILPDIVKEPYQINASELVSNYYVEFKTDSEDLTTFDNAGGTNAQCIFSQITPVPVNQNMLIGSKNITFAFATAKRKEDYTLIETMVSDLCGLFDVLYSGMRDLIGAPINKINQIYSWVSGNHILITNPLSGYNPFTFLHRKGAMLLETDFIGTPRLILSTNIPPDVNSPNTTNNGVPIRYLSPFNYIYVNPEFLLRNYHNHSFWLNVGSTVHNQFIKCKDKTVPFCCSDYNAVFQCNWIRTHEGFWAKTLHLVWTPEAETAQIDFDIKSQYVKNLQQTFIVDGVQV